MSRLPKRARVQAMALKGLLTAALFDETAWVAATSDHLHLRIGSMPPCLSRHTSLTLLREFLRGVETFGRDFCDVWQLRETIFIETDLCFSEQPSAGSVPCVVIARSQHGLIEDLRFYLDYQTQTMTMFPHQR